MNWKRRLEKSWGRLDMRYRLDEIVDVTMGQSPKSEYYNTEKNGSPFLQGNRTFGFKYPSFDTYTTVVTKFAKAGDVIMSVRAPVGALNITPADMCLGRGVCSLRMKNGNQSFLFYMMKYYVSHLLKRESGTVFGSVNRSDINGLEVDIPEDVEEQKRIARYLEMIDDKIELNNAVNNNLAEQIKTICTAWLSDYAPFDGALPDHWSKTPLSSIADFVSGYSYKGAELTESNIAMATIKNFDRKGGFKLDGYKEIIPSNKLKDTQHAELFDTLVAHTDLTQNAEVIGNAELVMSKSGYEDIVFSMDLVKVVPKNKRISKFLVAAILQDKKFKAHCLGYVNGTTVLHLSKKALLEYQLYLPDDLSVLKPLDELVTVLYQRISANIEGITKLEILRDTLLPKLMSGELDVSNIDI